MEAGRGRSFFFPVKSCYSLLENLFLFDGGVSVEEETVFRYLWKSPAPSKVLIFSSTLLLERHN